MKTEQSRLVWRFLGSIALIVATVGAAALAARWTGRIG
jgi:hypothetical protein